MDCNRGDGALYIALAEPYRRRIRKLALGPSNESGASLNHSRLSVQNSRNGPSWPHLKRIAAGEEAYYEERRRKQLSEHLAQAREEWVRQPPVWVEVSEAQRRRVEVHDFDGLPEGVELAPGTITVRFSRPDEALQKLMALAMAISQNRQAFDDRVGIPDA